jgi:AraC-like DNA-binding protein
MSSSAVQEFSDPDAYSAAVRAATVKLTVTEGADFAAKITRIDLKLLWMQGFCESAPRIKHAAHASDRSIITFLTQPGPEVTLNGAAMPSGQIIRHSSAQEYYHRTFGSVSWASMSLPTEGMAAAGAALAGCDLTPLRDALTVTPKPDAMAKLIRLHAAVGRLAEDAPEIIADPATAQGLEQSLIAAMVNCLDTTDVLEDSAARRRHQLIMRRFHRVVEENPDTALYIPEICAAIGVSQRTLYSCCEEYLRMGPKRYLLLRRMNLARRELRKAVPSLNGVTEIATKYGFWEFGRFAGLYKSIFGEKPSDTLRCVDR